MPNHYASFMVIFLAGGTIVLIFSNSSSIVLAVIVLCLSALPVSETLEAAPKATYRYAYHKPRNVNKNV